MSKSRNIRLIARNTDVGVIQMHDPATVNTDIDNVTTPLSPSSKYTNITLHVSDTIFSAVVLCYWDNILGPRILHVWNMADSPQLHNRTLMCVCTQTLSGEICRDVDNKEIDYKFYNHPDHGLIFPSFIFSAPGTCGPSVHSLSLIIPNSELKQYLQIHHLVQCCFSRLCGKLRILMNKLPCESSLQEFCSHLEDCIKVYSSLHDLGLPESIKLSDTAFSPSHVLERDFLHRCIVSHLITFCRSVIIGKTAERINLVISTLALFNIPSERLCSRHVHPEKEWTYHHDLWVQGLLKDNGLSELPVKEILCSKYPTTIIDMTSRNVMQSPSYQDHDKLSNQAHRNELLCLHHGQFEDIVLASGLFHSADFPDTLVQGLLNELSKLPAMCGVQEAYVTQFMRLLQKKAQCLIKCLEDETNQGTQNLKSGLRKVRQDLSLTMEGDFRIILAMAEKLKPGLFYLFMRDLDQGKTLDML